MLTKPAVLSMHVEQKSLSFVHIYIFVIEALFTKYATVYSVFCCSNQCCPCSYFSSKVFRLLPWQETSNKQTKLFVLGHLNACCSNLNSNQMEFQLKLIRDSYYDYITHSSQSTFIWTQAQTRLSFVQRQRVK